MDRENFGSYGHSVPGFVQNDRLGFGASFLANRKVNKKFSFETGLGLNVYRSQFHFNYTHYLLEEEVKETLNIAIYYLKIPLLINYNIRANNKSSFNVAIGTNTRFCIGEKGNFKDILIEDIATEGLVRYKFLINSPCIALGYQFNGKNNAKYKVAANIGIDLQGAMRPSYMYGGYGFYNNLFSAHYANYGVSLQYLFPAKFDK